MVKQPSIYHVLDKNMIEMEIVPIIPGTKKGFEQKANAEQKWCDEAFGTLQNINKPIC